MHCSGDGFIDNRICVCGGLRGLKMNEGTNDLSNGTMDRFNDRVGGGCIGGDLDGSDAHIIQRELEIVAGEFWTIVDLESS